MNDEDDYQDSEITALDNSKTTQTPDSKTSTDVQVEVNVVDRVENVIVFPEKEKYALFCSEKYNHARLRYNTKFVRELLNLELMQPSAYGAMKFYRHFTLTTMWPPLHTRKEIDYTLSKMFQLNLKQQSRLNNIIKN